MGGPIGGGRGLWFGRRQALAESSFTLGSLPTGVASSPRKQQEKHHTEFWGAGTLLFHGVMISKQESARPLSCQGLGSSRPLGPSVYPEG